MKGEMLDISEECPILQTFKVTQLLFRFNFCLLGATICGKKQCLKNECQPCNYKRIKKERWMVEKGGNEYSSRKYNVPNPQLNRVHAFNPSVPQRE